MSNLPLFAAALLACSFAAAPAARANISVNGTEYADAVSLGAGTYTITGTGNANNRIIAKKDCTIVLDGVSFAPTSCRTTGTLSKKYYGYPAIFVTNGVTATIKLKGANTITPASTKGNQTGLYVGTGAAVHVTNLTETASLEIDASSHSGNVGIGGWAGENVSGGSVTLWGGTIVAKGGENGAGIGGANGGTGATVTNWAANVTATGGKNGAGIGGGYQADGRACVVKGGSVAATGGLGAAGIGGGRSGGGWSLRVDGGHVSAVGGTGGAGIGGGRAGEGGTFYNFGGTVHAKGDSASSTKSADIGSGYGYSGSNSYICRITGGSTGLANGSVTGQNAASNATERVYRIVLTGLTAGRKYVFDGLSDKLSYTYGQNNIVADADGQVHVWLPPAEHVFTFDEDGKRYQFATANATGKQTLSPVEIPTTTTVTFVNWDGTTVAEYTDDPGAALVPPADPERTGHAFAGWSPGVPSVYPDKDATYTATWTVNRYTVSFDTDGGEAMDDASFDYGAAVSVADPVREGYVFAGWSPALPATMPAENLAVKATWDIAPFFRLVSVVPDAATGRVAVTYDSYNVDLSGGDFTLEVKDASGTVVATVTDWASAPSIEAGEQTAVWNAAGFLKTLSGPADYSFSLAVGSEAEAKYLVVDLADGSRTYLADVPAGGWTDEYKTSKLVLRKILGEGETATFTMGSPATEAGRSDNETQHAVTLTKPYWIGVFEFTQGQWAAVKGSSPSCGFSGATRPVETVAWADLKGGITAYGATSATGSSFLGALRSLTGTDLGLNLPTEAEWEYACRAGTTSAFNDGSDLAASNTESSDALDAIAVYDHDSGGATAAVGTKAPNAWGLHDMHGNVREWCHDASAERTQDATDLGSSAATDPTGVDNGATTPYRLIRGGSWYNYASSCRSARRVAKVQADTTATSGDAYTGFRVAAREFAGQATVGSRIDADGTATATLGSKPRKPTVISVF
ncbi:MAG: SUMF1/EgtB/PvdO family nonheme iron enzyme [Kiritimatiellae bacterium]|nr:SUMF1/EgtB/PvdO family nonheme iron enzyme [Kiritimatiellia bacterium]